MASEDGSLAGASVAPPAPASLAAPTLLWTLPNPTPEPDDDFGAAVAIDGDLILVGAPLDDTQGNNFGEAYLFDAITGALIRTIPEPTPSFADQFGGSVALSGDVAAIGAEFDSTDGFLFGAVHLIDVTTGVLLRTLTEAPVNDGAGFGGAVDFDGTRVLVGSMFDSGQGQDVGKAWLFDAATGDLIASFDDPTPTEGDKFGSAVALEGDLVLIGAPGDDTVDENIGQAHLFDAGTGALLRTFDDPTPTNLGNFGGALDLDGGRAAIAADYHGRGIGEVHLFDTAQGLLMRTFDEPTPSGFDRFGTSLALEGGALIVGSASARSAQNVGTGEAHLFDAGTGALIATFEDPAPTDFAQMGRAVALSDGRVVIGVPNRTDQSGERPGEALVFSVPIRAANDRAATPQDTAVVIDVLANDFGPDPESLFVTAVGAMTGPGNGPANGTVGLAGGSVRYTPDPGFSGVDLFDYSLGGQGGSDTATVAVRVGQPAPADGVTRGTGQDDALLIAQNATYLGGEGADLFLFSVAARENALSLIEGRAGDVLQLTEGLEVAAFVLTPDALLLDLPNGAQLRVLQADGMEFDVGGNVSTGDAGARTDFAGFAAAVLGVALPTAGESVSGGPLIVAEDLLA